MRLNCLVSSVICEPPQKKIPSIEAEPWTDHHLWPFSLSPLLLYHQWSFRSWRHQDCTDTWLMVSIRANKQNLLCMSKNNLCHTKHRTLYDGTSAWCSKWKLAKVRLYFYCRSFAASSICLHSNQDSRPESAARTAQQAARTAQQVLWVSGIYYWKFTAPLQVSYSRTFWMCWPGTPFCICS